MRVWIPVCLLLFGCPWASQGTSLSLILSSINYNNNRAYFIRIERDGIWTYVFFNLQFLKWVAVILFFSAPHGSNTVSAFSNVRSYPHHKLGVLQMNTSETQRGQVTWPRLHRIKIQAVPPCLKKKIAQIFMTLTIVHFFQGRLFISPPGCNEIYTIHIGLCNNTLDSTSIFLY